MTELSGEYEVAIDAKGRFLLPAPLRKQFPEGEGDKFFINRGFNNCLNIYPEKAWKQNLSKINELDEFDEESMKFKRLVLNGSPVELDNADRLLLPKRLQEKVNIVKDAIIIGLGNKMEIWDATTYYNFIDDNMPDLGKIAKSVMAKKKENQV